MVRDDSEGSSEKKQLSTKDCESGVNETEEAIHIDTQHVSQLQFVALGAPDEDESQERSFEQFYFETPLKYVLSALEGRCYNGSRASIWKIWVSF